MKIIRARTRLRKFFLIFFLLFATAGSVTLPSKEANAICICGRCAIYDCWIGQLAINGAHGLMEMGMKKIMQQTFRAYHRWLVERFFNREVLPALRNFSQYMVSNAMHQAQIVGMMLDAQQQLETQRLLRQLQNEAHRDYFPSEDFCTFGTNVRSMAATEALSRFHVSALNARQMARHLGQNETAGAFSQSGDKTARWTLFTTRYCDPESNGFSGGSTGLRLACGNGPADPTRINNDIDYSRFIDGQRTLELDFAEADPPADQTPDAEDVLAIGSNLYGHDVLTRNIDADYLKNEAFQGLYLALRSVAARRNVAENSFNAIVGLKAAGSSNLEDKDYDSAGGQPNTYQFLWAIMNELGVPDEELAEYIGERPSYYAQLEVMAKKLYQNTDFFADLYDKPANVKRKAVALKAIELMLDRAIYESELRQEMVSSVLLSTQLNKDFVNMNEKLLVGVEE